MPRCGRRRASTASPAPTAAARASTRSTPRRPRRPARCTSGTSSPSRTPTCSPGSTACAASASSTRWAGTTTACRPSAGCRTTTASAATRRSPTTPPSRRPPRAPRSRRRRRPDADLAPQLHRALRAPHRRGRAEVRGGVPRDRPLRRLAADLPDHRRRRPGDQPARVPRQPRARRGVPGGGAEPLGRDVPHRRRAGRARGPGAARRVPHGRVRGPGRPRWSSRRRGPSCCPRASRSWRTRTTSGTRTCSGRTVRSPVFGVEVPVVAHHLAQPDKGTGIAMVCTFGDLNDVTWWRDLQLPTRAVIGFDGRFISEPPAAIDRPRAARRTPSWPARRCSPRAPRWSSCCAPRAPCSRDPRPITHPVKFFEKGDRPLEIVSTRQWYLANGARKPELKQRLLDARRASSTSCPTSCACATTTGSAA